VLGDPIERDFGLPAGGAFLGVALVLGLGGLLTPAAGRLIDRHGARLAMAAGSLCFALGLAALAAAPGLAAALGACLLLGIAAALALTDAANAALAAFGAEGARRRLGLLAVISGLCTAIVWPALAVLEAEFGWRGAVLASAAAHLLVGLPLHLLCLPGTPRGTRAPAPSRAPLAPRLRWLSAALTLQVLVGSAVLGHMVALVEAMGLERNAAIFWASLAGPAQVAARLLDLAGGARFPALGVASAVMLVMPVTLLLPLLGGGTVAAVFVLTYGLASGEMSVMRPACLIELHGTEGYAGVAGRVMAPVTTAMAIAPAAFALLLHGIGAGPALAVASAACLAGFLLLRRAVQAR
jgi:MFS family permease